MRVNLYLPDRLKAELPLLKIALELNRTSLSAELLPAVEGLIARHRMQIHQLSLPTARALAKGRRRNAG